MPELTPADPDYRDRVLEGLAGSLASRFFGIVPGEISPGKVELLLDYRAELSHLPGWFQGSIVTALAEFASAYAAKSLNPAGWSSLTLDQHISFTGQARGARLIARGEVISSGKSISYCRAAVFAERDGALHPCAMMLQTNRRAPPR